MVDRNETAQGAAKANGGPLGSPLEGTASSVVARLGNQVLGLPCALVGLVEQFLMLLVLKLVPLRSQLFDHCPDGLDLCVPVKVIAC